MSNFQEPAIHGALEAQANAKIVEEARVLAKGKSDYAFTKVAELEGRLSNCPPEHLALLLYEIQGWNNEFYSWETHSLEFSDFEDIMNNGSPLRVEGTRLAYHQSINKAKRLLGMK